MPKAVKGRALCCIAWPDQLHQANMRDVSRPGELRPHAQQPGHAANAHGACVDASRCAAGDSGVPPANVAHAVPAGPASRGKAWQCSDQDKQVLTLLPSRLAVLYCTSSRTSARQAHVHYALLVHLRQPCSAEHAGPSSTAQCHAHARQLSTPQCTPCCWYPLAPEDLCIASAP